MIIPVLIIILLDLAYLFIVLITLIAKKDVIRDWKNKISESDAKEYNVKKNDIGEKNMKKRTNLLLSDSILSLDTFDEKIIIGNHRNENVPRAMPSIKIAIKK